MLPQKIVQVIHLDRLWDKDIKLSQVLQAFFIWICILECAVASESRSKLKLLHAGCKKSNVFAITVTDKHTWYNPQKQTQEETEEEENQQE